MATRKSWLEDPVGNVPLRSLGGGVFAVLAVMWALLAAGAPKMGASTPDITSYYDDHGNRVKIGIATFQLMLAPLFLLWFLGRLEERLAHGCRRARTLHEGRVGIDGTQRAAEFDCPAPDAPPRGATRNEPDPEERAESIRATCGRCQPYGTGGGTPPTTQPLSGSSRS
ncbi:MAG TPA: hypothetical protein VN960_06650 [Gaiellaceae bacterium]|nr:hypothetical protein [Gaiellaceae bacterium]